MGESITLPLIFSIMNANQEHLLFAQYFEKGIQIIKAAREYFGKENVDSNIISLYYNFKANYPNCLCEDNIHEALNSIYNDSLTYLKLYFPKITVTNERGDSTIIYDTYVRVPIDLKIGTITGKFNLLRTTYTKAQLINRYCHSHVPSINLTRLENWMEPCLGSGPINVTISRLTRIFDIDVWGLFFFELKKYLRTESLEGIPYKKLTQSKQIPSKTFDVKSLCNCSNDSLAIVPEIFKMFMKYFILNNHLQFTFSNSIILAETPEDLWVRLSNSFLKWSIHYKSLKDLISEGIIIKGIYKDYKLIALDNTDVEVACRQDTPIIKFKGYYKYLSIIRQEDTDENSTSFNYMLNPKLIVIFIKRVLNIINIRYFSYLNHEYLDYEYNKFNKYRSV